MLVATVTTRFGPGLGTIARATLIAAALSSVLSWVPITPAHAQAPGFEELKAAQAAANARPGPRRVPARTIPVPDAVSPEARALIANQYWLPAWDVRPGSAEAWRALVQQTNDAARAPLARLRTALGVTIQRTTMGGVTCFVLTPETVPEAHRDQLILNLHGGGYVYGSGVAGTQEATMLAAYGGYRVIAIDYRMPPDASYPAAVDDAIAVYRAALRMHDPRRIAIVGTSAGGGLTLATILHAKAEGLPVPGAIAPSTPWADLTDTGDSYRTNEWLDNVLISYRGYISRSARLYADGRDLRDPGLSPIYGDFRGFPPAILTTGTRDLFLSNTVRAHRKLRRSRVRADLQVFEGFSHALYLFDPLAPETRETFREITAFFDEHLAR